MPIGLPACLFDVVIVIHNVLGVEDPLVVRAVVEAALQLAQGHNVAAGRGRRARQAGLSEVSARCALLGRASTAMSVQCGLANAMPACRGVQLFCLKAAQLRHAPSALGTNNEGVQWSQQHRWNKGTSFPTARHILWGLGLT